MIGVSSQVIQRPASDRKDHTDLTCNGSHPSPNDRGKQPNNTETCHPKSWGYLSDSSDRDLQPNWCMHNCTFPCTLHKGNCSTGNGGHPILNRLKTLASISLPRPKEVHPRQPDGWPPATNLSSWGRKHGMLLDGEWLLDPRRGAPLDQSVDPMWHQVSSNNPSWYDGSSSL